MILKLRLFVVIFPLSMFEFPLFEMPDVLGLDSGFVDGLEVEGILPADDIFEFGHFEVDSFEDFGFGEDAGEFVDFVEFGLEFIKGFVFFLKLEFELFKEFRLFGLHVVVVSEFFAVLFILFFLYGELVFKLSPVGLRDLSLWTGFGLFGAVIFFGIILGVLLFFAFDEGLEFNKVGVLLFLNLLSFS